MKRFHVHVAVGDLDEGIRFYSTLFDAPPTVRKPDYAKWMVEDPRLNFAISQRGRAPGLDHLGFQLDSDEALKAMRSQLAAADAGLVEEVGANCCYAKSDKYWVSDPAGIAWETYHTLGSIPMYGAQAQPAADAGAASVAGACCAPASETAVACCTPASAKAAGASPVKAKTGCCP